MRYKRNALFNRDWANRYFCQEEDIIIDMDADDWIIGTQVFQLVNNIYQAGKFTKTKENSYGQHTLQILQKQKIEE